MKNNGLPNVVPVFPSSNKTVLTNLLGGSWNRPTSLTFFLVGSVDGEMSTKPQPDLTFNQWQRNCETDLLRWLGIVSGVRILTHKSLASLTRVIVEIFFPFH